MPTHEIETSVRYSVEDHASAAASKVAAAFHHTGEKAAEAREKVSETFKEGTHHALLMGAGVLGVGLGFEQLIEKVKESNVEFTNAKRGVEGILFSMLDWPKGASAVEKVTAAQEVSTEVMERLEGTSYRFATGLTDVAEAYKLITISTGRYRMSQEQLQALTTKAVAAHRIFGISGQEAADAIGKTLLTKTVRASGEFGKFLRMNLGDLHRLNNQQILVKLNKALSDLPAAGEKMSVGMDASLFRIQHTVEQLIRGLTGPAFVAVSKKLEEWAQYLQKASDNGKPLIEVYGQKLVEMLREAKDAVAFLFDHWKAIAAIWAASKVPGGVGGIVGGLAGKLGMAGAGGIGAELGPLMGKLGAVIPALGALAFAAQEAADGLEAHFTKRLEDKNVGESLETVFKEMGTAMKAKGQMAKFPGQEAAAEAYIQQHFRVASKVLQAQGLVAEDGKLKLERFNEVMSAISDDTLPRFAEAMGMKGIGSQGELAAGFAESFRMVADKVAPPAPPPQTTPEGIDASKLRTRGGAQINIYGGLHLTQDFKDQDPDRVWIRMKEDIEGQAENRVKSQLAETFSE